MHTTRSDVEPVDPSLVPLLVSQLDIAQSAQVALVTLLVYDTITTMDSQVKYFWSSPRKSVSLIYFANRYIGILGVMSGIGSYTLRANDLLCLCIVWISGLANWMILLLIDYILLMRVLALYHQERKLAACLRALFVVDAAFTLGIFIYGKLREEIVAGRLADDVTICGVDGNLPNVWGAMSWAVPMAWAITLMVLALCKAAEFWRISSGFKDFSLVKVLMQDQAVHFILVIFCSIINIISDQLQISNDFLAGIIGILGSPSFLCVVGSRLLVHLKEAGERGLNGGTSYGMRTVTSIKFS